jgi:hypothetical protein
MSAVDDIRKLLQDLVTPDFKSLQLRVDLLEKNLGEKIDLQRDLLMAEIKASRASTEVLIAKLTHSLELERRVAKIENDRAADQKNASSDRAA